LILWLFVELEDVMVQYEFLEIVEFELLDYFFNIATFSSAALIPASLTRENAVASEATEVKV